MAKNKSEQYIIELGFKADLDTLKEQLKDNTEEIDKVVDGWVKKLKILEKAANQMGFTINEAFEGIENAEISKAFDVVNNKAKTLGFTLKEIGKYGVQISEAFTGLGQKITKITTKGTTEKYVKSEAGSNLYPDLDFDEMLANETDRTTTYLDIAGADKTSKENLKKNISDTLKEYGQISEEKQKEILDNFEQYVSKMKVAYNKDGLAIGEWVDVQVDEYTRLTQAIKRFTVEKEGIDGETITYSSMERVGGPKVNVDFKKIQSDGENLIKTLSKLQQERDRLLLDSDSGKQVGNTLFANEKEIDNIINKLGSFGVTFDKETGEIKQDIQETTEYVRDFSSVIEKSNQEISNNKAKIADTKLNKDIEEYIGLIKEVNNLDIELIKAKSAKSSQNYIEELNRQLIVAKEKQAGFSDEVKSSTKALEAQEEATNRLNIAQGKIQNNIERTGNLFGSLKKQVLTVAKNTFSYTLAYKALNSGDEALRKTIKTVRELDTAMTEIQMVTGETDEATRELLNTYSEMGQQLGATTLDVAKGSVEWLRQGKTVEETNKLLTASTMLSKVGMIDAAEATELMTAALNGFKLSADDAMGIVDKLSAVDLAYATSAEEIAVALQYVASSAGMANVSLDKMIGLITVVSQTTRLSAEQIGQSFKTIIARMQNIKVGKFVDDETGEALLNRSIAA